MIRESEREKDRQRDRDKETERLMLRVLTHMRSSIDVAFDTIEQKAGLCVGQVVCDEFEHLIEFLPFHRDVPAVLTTLDDNQLVRNVV